MKRKLTKRGGITPYDILPYLPHRRCFFDSRHWVVGIDELPFAVTTRIAANNQQYLFDVQEESDEQTNL